MSNQTEKLKLFKWDMLDQVDLNSNFDIEKTLNENWDKIDNNAKEIEKQVNGKIDKVEGKELSTNDFTSNYKEKLENLENYDDTEIKQSIEEVTIKNSEQDNSISKMQEDLENLKNIINTISVVSQKGEDITLNNTVKDVQFRKFAIYGNVKRDGEANLENSVKIKTVGSNVNLFNILKYPYRNYNEASEQITDGTNFRIIATTSKNSNNAAGFKIMDLTEYAGKTLTMKAKVKSSTSTNKGFLVLRQNNTDYTGTKSNEKYDETQNTTDGVIMLNYKVSNIINDSNRYLFAWFYATRGSECDANDYVDYTVKIVEGTEVGEHSQYDQGSSKAIIENSTTINIKVNKTVQNNKHNYLLLSFTKKDIYPDLQVEYKKEVSQYEEHQEQSYIMPVQKEMLTDDYLDWDNGEEVHCWNKLVLNGTENDSNFSVESNGEYTVINCLNILENGKRVDEDKILCDKLVSKYGDTSNTEHIRNASSNYPNNVVIYMQSSRLEESTVAAFKKYLSTNNITIYYKTATEKRIAFTDEQKVIANKIQKATSYEDTTHIYSTDEVSPVFDVEAVIDLKKLIANTSTTAEGEN